MNRTSQLINRAHDTDCYYEAVAKLRKHGIRVCTHIIYGLPQETHEMMLDTCRAVANMDVQGIKIHLLHLMRKTPMVKQYEAGLLRFLEMDEYVKLIVDSLEILPPEMIVHRLTGDAPRDLLIGPMWSLNKWEVLNAIDAELRARHMAREAMGDQLAWVFSRCSAWRTLDGRTGKPGDTVIDATSGGGVDTLPWPVS